MKKRLTIVLLLLFVTACAFVTAANVFPDQVWNAISLAQDYWAAAFRLRSQPPPAKQPLTPVPYLDAEGYAVISAWKEHSAGDNVIFVRREISPDPHYRDEPDAACLPGELRYRYRPAIQDLASKWHQPAWLVEDRFSDPHEFMVRPQSELPVNDPRKNNTHNAAGYFIFSAVGFNRDRTRAAIHVIHWDGRLGLGNIFLMRKNTRGVWEIEGYGECGWIT